jgi:hypothetical protein
MTECSLFAPCRGGGTPYQPGEPSCSPMDGTRPRDAISVHPNKICTTGKLVAARADLMSDQACAPAVRPRDVDTKTCWPRRKDEQRSPACLNMVHDEDDMILSYRLSARPSCAGTRAQRAPWIRLRRGDHELMEDSGHMLKHNSVAERPFGQLTACRRLIARHALVPADGKHSGKMEAVATSATPDSSGQAMETGQTSLHPSRKRETSTCVPWCGKSGMMHALVLRRKGQSYTQDVLASLLLQ